MNRLLTIVDSKYQRLEYLESTGTQYIDTGYVPTEDDVIECDLQQMGASDSGDKFFFGQRNADTSKGGLWVEQYNTGNVWYTRFGSLNSVGGSPTSSETNSKIHITLKKGSFVSSGGSSFSPIWSGTMQSTNLTLFGRFSSDGQTMLFSKIKMWNFRVTNNGVTKLNLVPLLRKTDNELGMLDLVEGKFYTNAGTGKFTANLDTMYAIIQGSPTQSPYGVFSGFSTSNYLITQQYLKPQNDSWEIKLAVTTGNDITTDQGIASPLGIGINSVLFWCSGGKINIQLYDNTNNYFLGNVFNVQVNTKYYLKVTYIATEQRYIIAYSTDNTNYTLILNSVRDKIINQPDKYYNFGTARGQNRPFLGSIDLNRSYIKIGATKYNLQAVVGYTVVGSPNITDGVASGFSDSNYLQISNTTSNENIEIVTRFKFNTSENGQKPIFGFRDKWTLPFFYVIANRVSGYAGDIYANLQSNNWYRVKFTYNGTLATCEVYNDNNILISSNSREYSATIQQAVVRIGGTYSTLSVVIDSIDLNETYIKINNKLWFNGQQA